MKIEDPYKKKEVLKLLKIIGIDTRFISYTENTIYINDQRFSKFSKKRQETFNKYYPEMNIISSGTFQKICIRASKVLSEQLSPKDKILLLKPENDIDELLKIVLEPYSRKYGVQLIESNIKASDIDKIDMDFNIIDSNIDFAIDKDINIIARSLTLDEKVEDVLSNIFSGNGIGDINKKENKEFKFIYPFINISNNWIDSFNKQFNENYIDKNKDKKNKNETSIIIADSFMEFLDNIIPQYKENFLKSTIFIENNLNKKN
ncbi:ATPase [Methanobrevibacter sp. TMH8]|uniref:ATPase n=1 Tax=Methanobrevibacter sp. TMH8 TaxID=2848611 RepID=UPI001CCC8475|nr:ATPase [Methanobrevibacter sp. TMH8]MBZ9570637.1 ATPase [Methanobrevibacter sp. TMH8]